ncbi:serine hydrolase [Acetonema longum]|uniref:Beta-lactamase n=1 Tax=Acetonema longum DSM 6540 TaxID=1009370 RepID=F7NMC7_9FIRM|nr:serine hydrolase [Acetonema longum]EGO62803.1 beta-lactamase [Acetonema longum DSM 6540]
MSLPPSRLAPLAGLIQDRIQKEPGFYSLAVSLPDTQDRISINSRRMSSASLIKIYIMTETLRQAKEGILALDELLTVTAANRVGGAGELEFAAYGSQYTILHLVEVMITESDNTATNLLIDRIGMDSVNRCMAGLNAADTELARRMMDFAARQEGRDNYTSVTDMVSVLERLYHRCCLDPFCDSVMLAILKQQQDRVKIPLYLPPGTVVAHKTGELDYTEHDAGIVYGSKHSYAVAIMAEQLMDVAYGRHVIANMSKLIFEYIQELP